MESNEGQCTLKSPNCKCYFCWSIDFSCPWHLPSFSQFQSTRSKLMLLWPKHKRCLRREPCKMGLHGHATTLETILGWSRYHMLVFNHVVLSFLRIFWYHLKTKSESMKYVQTPFNYYCYPCPCNRPDFLFWGMGYNIHSKVFLSFDQP